MPRSRFAEMSVEELKQEVLRRRRTLPRLLARRAALDKQISELQDLVAALANPKRLRRKLAKKRAGKSPAGARAGNLADQIAEVFQGRKGGSFASEILLRDENRFQAVLGAFKDEPAPKLSDEQRSGGAVPGVDRNAPALARADANPKACAALSAHRTGAGLHLADESREECGAQVVDEDGPKTQLTEEDGKVRLLGAIRHENVFAPRMK